MQRKYCYEKIVKPGSAFYYSLRQLNPSQRDEVVAVHAFYKELEDVIFSSQEPNVSLAKLAWWHSEVLSDKPSHPAMVFLQQFNFPKEKLSAIIDGMTDHFHPAQFATFEDLVVHFIRTAGARELLLIKKSSPELVYQLMLVVELTNYLQHLRHYLQHGIIYFPADEMLKFGVTYPMLGELKMTPEIHHLLQYQAEKIERAYQAAKENLTAADRKELSFLLIRSKIAHAVLKEIQHSDFPMFEQIVSLTPIRYWWIAWRH